MAVVDRDISPKPIDEDSTLDALNREIVPVARQMRAALNRYLMAYSVTVGDGVTTNFTVTHNLGTEDVSVVVRTISSGLIVDPVLFLITAVDKNTVNVIAPAAPALNDLRISVRV